MIGEGLALWLEKDLVKCSYKVGKVLNIKWQTIDLKIHKDNENTRSFYKEPSLRNQKSKPKFLPRQWRTGRRLSPFLVALGHTSANAVKAKAGGWSTGSSACLTFPLHSLMSSARREGSEHQFRYDSAGPRTHDLPVVRQTLYHWAITPVIAFQNFLILGLPMVKLQ